MSNQVKQHFYVNKGDENIDNDSDKAVSIHSIVTENDDALHSGNEAPEDMYYQEVKIVKNYVVKRILTPGKGYEKPSKHDYLESK